MRQLIRVVIVVAASLAVAAGDLAGQTGVIRGRVLRSDGPVGLAEAEVTLSLSGATAHTDARGYFAFRGIGPGRVALVARRPGFISSSSTLLVDSVGTTEVEIRLEPIAAVLDPIVTSATRDARSLREIPVAVSVADSSAILRDRTVGLHEVLRMMPGVQVASRYGTLDVNIGIRGSAARTSQSVRGVAVLLDGVPVTQPEGRTRIDIVELAAARQVEVVRGPASALYAASAGGVVNVVSRTGRDSPGITIRSQGGAFGFRKLDARAGGSFGGDRGSALAAVSYTSTDGYRIHSDADALRGHVVLDYQAGTDTRVSFQATGSRAESRLPGGLTLPQFEADPDAASPAAEIFEFGRDDNNYRVGVRVESAVGTAMADGYLFYGDGSLFLPLPFEILDSDLSRLQGGARYRSGPIADGRLIATIGLDYDRFYGTTPFFENHAGTPGELVDSGSFINPGIGAYAQADWRASSVASVILGLRYDAVDYVFESDLTESASRRERQFHQASPRLAVRLAPGPTTSVYASIGRGFEAPILPELAPTPSGPLEPVRPKSLWNYELGARSTIGDRVLVEAAAFVAFVRGEFVPITGDGILLVENASRSRNAGVELAVTALATSWLDVSASYTFLDLRLEEYTTAILDSTGTSIEVDFSGKRLPAVPRQRVTGDAQVRLSRRFRIGAQVEWQGKVYVETGNADHGIWYFRMSPDGDLMQVPFSAVPSRTLVHLNAACDLGPVTLFGRVENLFAETYAGNVRANDIFGQFYEAGSQRWGSFGISLSGWGSSDHESP